MAETRQIKISNLTEKPNIVDTDWLVVEDSDDTKKVKMKTLTNYIDNEVAEQAGTISEAIQDQMDAATALLEQMAEGEDGRSDKFSQYETQEAQRQANEEARKANEEARVSAEKVRENAEANRVSKENNRVNAENSRVSAESARVTAENSRVSAESARVTAENTRASNENTRKTNETNRKSAETARSTAETARQNGYAEMTQYFSNVKTFIEDRSAIGLSKTVSTANYYIDMLDITFKKGANGYEANKWYSVLIHIYEQASTEAGNKSAFVYGKFKLIASSNGNFSSINYKVYVNSISVITNDNIKVIQTKTNNNITISFYYKCQKNSKVECHRISDNLTVFDESLLTSRVNDKETAVASLPSGTNYTISNISDLQKSSIAAGDAEIHLVTLMEQLKVVRAEMAKIKPINYYPVGIIIETTTSDNPAIALEGGTWELMYGGPMTQTITDEDGNIVSEETTYKWKRKA